ncbi:MAG: HEAT repeat domain-containing protein [Deltaproteobacteria bacterium]|nr:HEAT repeat domain-containing protein [Myxococcales bacterium]MDP3217294.1 HEAT repeat domain-containing protein [Deltaproteobacteria bacterium]
MLFVSDHSHDAGVAAAMAGRDPRRGMVEFLPLDTAASVAGFFGGEPMAAVMREAPPARCFPLLTIYRQRVNVGHFAEHDLPGALPDLHVLDAKIATMTHQQPSESLFEELVGRDPARLLAYLSDPDLDPTLLTYAAEIAGRIPDAAVVRALVPLLDHVKAYVREGAVYGLAQHLPDSDARSALGRVASTDPLAVVREIAAEQLAEAAAG